MKFQKRSACMLGLLLIFACMAGYAVPARATAGEYSSMLRIPAPDRPGDADVVDEAPLRQAADGLSSPSPSSLVLGLLVACLVCVGCLGWNTVLQLRLRRWQRTEADLSGRLALKQALVDGIPYPVSIRTLDGRLLACNRNYLESLRMTREQARGTLLTDSDWVEGSKARLMHQQCLAVARGGTASFTDMAVRIGGQLLEIHHWVTPYRDRQGRMLGLMNGWIDITERERLARQLREAMRQADEANRAKSVFLATMSHEIRTPMNAVIGILELVLQRLAPEQRERASLEVAYEAAGSLQLLIGDILDVAKIESGHLTLTPERVRLRHVVESVRRMFEGLARQKGLRLVVELDDAPGRDVLIDPLRFKQVLSNLVSNAIKFTERGQVTIRLQERSLDEGGRSSGWTWRIPVSVSLRRTRRACSSLSSRWPRDARCRAGPALGWRSVGSWWTSWAAMSRCTASRAKAPGCRSTCSCASAGRKCLNPARTRWQHPWSRLAACISSSPTTIRPTGYCCASNWSFSATGWRKRRMARWRWSSGPTSASRC